MKKSRKKMYIIVLFLIAFSGSIFFFPVNLASRYTCFYHRLFDHNDQVNKNTNTASSQDEVEEHSDSNGSILLEKYLHHYAFPWWFSVALTALSIFLWKRLKKDLSRISRN